MRKSMRRSLAGIVSAALVMVGVGVAAPQAAQAATCATTPMTMTWNSALAGGLVVDLPILSVAVTPVTVDWGDSTAVSNVATGLKTLPAGYTAHTYATAGTYTITICGGLQQYGWQGTLRGASGFTAVTSLPSTLTSLFFAFWKCTNLTDVPSSLPSSVTNLQGTFSQATSFNDSDVTSWNTTNVTIMSQAFAAATAFNQPIGVWNTAKVTDMSYMFQAAAAFNQPLSAWSTGAVTNMMTMFKGASLFNQNIGTWDVSKVTTMESMFQNAVAFNNGGSDAIKNWNPASVTTLSNTFNNAATFNQPIGSWNTARVTTLMYAFYGAVAFDQDLGLWNTGAVTNMTYAFSNAKVFDNLGSDSIGNWNTSKVTNFKSTFAADGNSARPTFNRNIGAWNTSAATDMSFMFSSNTAFNNNGSDSIKNWNTAKVTTFQQMFGATPFNQPIGTWNVSAATSIATMFSFATAFDQDISAWTPSLATTMAGFWWTTQNVMSVANYDKLLISWSGKVLKPSVPLGFGKHQFSCAAEAARATLSTAPISWTITDGGLAETAPSISTIVPGNGSLSVYVTAPTCMSVKRTTYEYSTDGGTTWVTLSPASLTSPIVIPSLTNGTEYTVQVRAAGGTAGWIGTSTPASASQKGTPASSAGITAKNDTSVYGATVPTIGYDTTLAAGDWIDGTITCGAYTESSAPFTTPVTSATKPGTYVTHCSGPIKSGLGADMAYTDGTYSVTKAPLSITAKSFAKTYGQALILDGTSDLAVSGLVGTDAVSSVTLTTAGDVAGAAVAGSPYSVVPSAAVGAASLVLADWYAITYTNGAITVNRAPALTVSATSNIFTYDYLQTANPADITAAVTYSATGFVNSESFATGGYTAPTCGVYDGATLKSPAYSTLAAGIYTVRCSGGSAANYDGITYSEGTFTVKGPNIAVTALNGSSSYGTAPAADTGYDNVGDLNVATVTCAAYEDSAGTTPVVATTRPGTYFTICTGPADNGAVPAVAIDYTNGAYTVTKVPLTITGKSFSKTYGDVLSPNGASDFTPSGLVSGDTVSSVTLTTSGAVGAAGVALSPYAVTPSAAVLSGKTLADYYDVTYVNGAITVGKKTLSVTADNVSLKVGNAVPTSYTATYTGWVNGENETTTQPAGWAAPTCESSFNSTTPVGTPVAVTCSGGAAADYEFTFTSGTVSVGNPAVTVQNTTTPAYETSGATANVALKATITSWAPGCLVTFTLNPSAGTASPYTVYTTASNDVSVSANLPVGVYDITTSVSEGCTGTPDTTGIVAVVPIGPGGAAHVDTYGVRYKDSTTGKTVSLDSQWLRKLVRTKNAATGLYESSYGYDSYYNWSIYGGNQWRIASKPFPGKITLGTGANTASVSTWGRMDCPAGMYPAGNASICSAITNIVTLRKWVPTSPGSKYGTWATVGDVLIVEKLAQGLWPYRCATVACKTALPSYLSFQMRAVPGAASPTVIPAGLPANTAWTRLLAGSVEHKQV